MVTFLDLADVVLVLDLLSYQNPQAPYTAIATPTLVILVHQAI